jgi:hypothetical protein
MSVSYCSRCRQDKDIIHFTKGKRIYKTCQYCRVNCNKSRNPKTPQTKISEKHKEDEEYIKCKLCTVHKSKDQFKGKYKDYVTTCIDCRKRSSKRCEHGKHKHACKECGTYKYISKKKQIEEDEFIEV